MKSEAGEWKNQTTEEEKKKLNVLSKLWEKKYMIQRKIAINRFLTHVFISLRFSSSFDQSKGNATEIFMCMQIIRISAKANVIANWFLQ